MSTRAPRADLFEVRSPGEVLLFGLLCFVTLQITAQLLLFLSGHELLVTTVAHALSLTALPLLYVRVHPVDLAPTLRVTPLPTGSLSWIGLLAVAVLLPLIQLSMAWQTLIPIPPEAVEKMAEAIPDSPTSWALTLFSVGVVVPIGEELVFRGLMQQAARRVIGGVPAAVLVGFVFALLHRQPWNMASLVAFGILLGLVFEATGSLTATIALHALYNVAVISLYGVASQVEIPSNWATAFAATASLGLAWAAYGRLRRVRAWETDPGDDPPAMEDEEDRA